MKKRTRVVGLLFACALALGHAAPAAAMMTNCERAAQYVALYGELSGFSDPGTYRFWGLYGNWFCGWE